LLSIQHRHYREFKAGVLASQQDVFEDSRDFHGLSKKINPAVFTLGLISLVVEQNMGGEPSAWLTSAKRTRCRNHFTLESACEVCTI
jgi:hypothetical protein